VLVSRVIALAFTLALVPINAAFAGDIPVGHPWRKQILDAARPVLLYDSRWRFHVVELWASERWAFLCTFVQDENGHLSRTDDYLDLTLAILERKSGRWVVVSQVDNLVSSEKQAECRPGGLRNNGPLSDKNVEKALKTSPWADGKRNG
jgi:hypothetical protein